MKQTFCNNKRGGIITAHTKTPTMIIIEFVDRHIVEIAMCGLFIGLLYGVVIVINQVVIITKWY